MSWLKRFFKFREKDDGGLVKPFLDHMEDLRWTLIKMGVTLAAGMVISFFFTAELTRLLMGPLLEVTPPGAPPLIVLRITESFMISLSLAFYAGIMLTFPFLLYFLAEFVLPALSQQEKKYVLPGIGVGFLLFGIGVVVCFNFILPQTLGFFYRYGAAMEFQNQWQAREYFSFVTHLCLAFGLLCELPVAIITLAALRIVSYEWLSRTRPYAVVVILVLAAIIAPTPDPLTFISMGAPIIALYEMCIWIVWLMERRIRRREARKAMEQ